MKNRILRILLFLLFFSCNTTKINVEKEEISILWPPPPDKARIKFIKTIRSQRDVEGKKKKSLKDILLGIEPDKSSIALGRPMDIAVNSKGDLLVVDSKTVGIHLYNMKDRKFKIFGILGMGTLSWPNSIEVDKNDNIYVTDHTKKKVFKYDLDGKFIIAFGDFENPVGLCYDWKNERIFVVDSKKHNVFYFNGEGMLLGKFGERGVEEGQFNFPTFCDVDLEGNIYVVDTGNSRVQIFDENLEVLGSFGSLGVHPGQFTRPKGIAVDKSGIIYVVDGAFSNVQMFDKEMRFLMPFCQAGSNPGKLLLPVGIEVDENGYIYVADYGNGRIQIFQAIYDIE